MKLLGNLTNQDKTVFQTSSDNKAVTITPTTTLTGANLTLTLPNPASTTDTLVSRTSTDTLTNKTATSLSLGTNASLLAAAPLRFYNAAGTFYTSLAAGSNLANATFTLPIADGTANQVLKTDGAGQLGFASVLTNPMTSTGDIIYSSNGSGTPARLAIGTKGKMLRAGATIPEYTFGSVSAIASADYTILDNDGFNELSVTTGAADRTMTLPTLADNQGREIDFKKVDSGAGNVIIDGEGAETIDGATTLTIRSQYENFKLRAGPTQWEITSGFPRTAFCAINSGADTVDGTAFVTTYTENFDLGGNFASGEFTVPNHGSNQIYQFSARMTLSGVTDQSRMNLELWKDTGGGYALLQRFGGETSSSPAGHCTICGSFLDKANAGDKYKLKVNGDDVTGVATDGTNGHFSAVRIA